ncbi:hypothetical protein IMG5_131310 [Ichthyophthirius multifiliis]|uniref:Transmembrane protein n=1 Tax=Ichthyophthirius multifiliis TaxID=5932 RepID=G0QWE0_ICHMU|nr:hypothetical protein IMG5_131310 [Ichthyophthirius multifiliis]EGR30457.1 hypothetical protein IMG5_131310 [Ichthyophthirius multifiliis]|eukprot:XP_004032044.1 hypothetical protein IMG5_131310 [Ichthyophthirius multifiliis]
MICLNCYIQIRMINKIMKKLFENKNIIITYFFIFTIIMYFRKEDNQLNNHLIQKLNNQNLKKVNLVNIPLKKQMRFPQNNFYLKQIKNQLQKREFQIFLLINYRKHQKVKKQQKVQFLSLFLITQTKINQYLIKSVKNLFFQKKYKLNYYQKHKILFKNMLILPYFYNKNHTIFDSLFLFDQIYLYSRYIVQILLMDYIFTADILIFLQYKNLNFLPKDFLGCSLIQNQPYFLNFVSLFRILKPLSFLVILFFYKILYYQDVIQQSLIKFTLLICQIFHMCFLFIQSCILQYVFRLKNYILYLFQTQINPAR